MVMSLGLQIEAQIEAVVKKEIVRIKEEVVQEATKSFEKQVREMVGTVAVNAAKLYSVEHMGGVLQVRIQTGEMNGR